MWLVIALLSAGIAVFGLLAGRTVQIIDPFDPVKRELTGQLGTPVGPPLSVLVLDRRPLLDPPAGESIPLFDRSLAYPIQMRTFWFIYGWVTGVVITAGLALTLLVYAVSRRTGASARLGSGG